MAIAAEKRAWRVASQDAQDFRALFDPSCYQRWEVAGSIRRNQTWIGDVEHVIIPSFGEAQVGGNLFPQRINLLWARLEELVAAGMITKHVYGQDSSRWGNLYRGVDFRGFCHELFLASESNWGSTLLIRTGPASFGPYFMQALKSQGYSQSGGSLYQTGSTEPVSVPTEEIYFRLAGLQYIPPEKRA